jgi:hypothetical protein
MKINEITEMQGSKPAIIKNLKPGQSAEVDNMDGTKTIIDLKKNPSALQKDPKTKKVTINKKPQPGTKTNPATTVKRGDKVFATPGQ